MYNFFLLVVLVVIIVLIFTHKFVETYNNKLSKYNNLYLNGNMKEGNENMCYINLDNNVIITSAFNPVIYKFIENILNNSNLKEVDILKDNLITDMGNGLNYEKSGWIFYINNMDSNIPKIISGIPILGNDVFNTYVINLERCPDRLKHIKGEISKTSIHLNNINIVKAFDGKSLKEEELIEFNKNTTRKLNLGEIGCYISHYNTWNLIANGDRNWGIIFEDDLNITEYGWDSKLNNYLSELDCDILYCSDKDHMSFYDIIGEDVSKYFDLNNKKKEEYVNDIYIKPGPVLGLMCYVVSKKGAKILCESMSKIIAPVDVQINFPHVLDRLNVYCLLKPLVKHEYIFETTVQK